MILKRVWLAAIGVTALAWSSVAAAQSYRPGDFLNLDLSKAVLSPKPLGPATSFTPGPLDVTVDRGNNPALANAELVVDPKTVSAETVHAESSPAASGALARRSAAPPERIAHARTERPAPHRPLVALHGRNPIEARAEDLGTRAEIHAAARTANRSRIQVWPCKSGGICDWKR